MSERTRSLWAEDAVVTFAVATSAMLDIHEGVRLLVDPRARARLSASPVARACASGAPDDASLLLAGRLVAVSIVEGGIGALAVALYRLHRWHNGRPFNPVGLVSLLLFHFVSTLTKLGVVLDTPTGPTSQELVGALVTRACANAIVLLCAHVAYNRTPIAPDPARAETDAEARRALLFTARPSGP
jgi:hypothetical protein